MLTIIKVLNCNCVLALVLTAILGCTGCGGFFDEKPTEIQTENILRDLSRIKVLPDYNVAELPIYSEPPAMLDANDGTKLLYFVRNQTVPEISELISQQFGYPVSQVAATNQLIVKCKGRPEAEAVLDFLKKVDLPPIQVRIDCIVSELYADVTMDWETTILIQNLFGEQIVLGGKIDASGNVLPAFPGASIRDQARSQIGLKAGINRGVEGHKFVALIDTLVSRGYLKIMMNPSLEIVNGKTAKIISSERVPIQKEVQSQLQLPYNITEYVDVVDSLMITPHVFADGVIGLETSAVLGSKATPEGVKQISILTRREVQNDENRIRQGESLIIGGIKKTEKRSVVRGVPFLKDIPIVGILFSSKDFEERAKETIFIITPSISSGGVVNSKIAEELVRRHEMVKYDKPLGERLLDPLGVQAKKEEKWRSEERAEIERLNAERARVRAEKAENEARKLRILAEQAGIEKGKAEQLKAQAAQAQAEAEKARAEAIEAEAQVAKAAAEAEKAKKEAEAAQAQQAAAEAEKAALETKKLAAEAEKARAEAEQKAAEAQKAAAQSNEAAAQAAAQKAIAEAEKAKADALKAAAEAEKTKIEAEILKARAEAAAAEEKAEPNVPVDSNAPQQNTNDTNIATGSEPNSTPPAAASEPKEPNAKQ